MAWSCSRGTFNVFIRLSRPWAELPTPRISLTSRRVAYARYTAGILANFLEDHGRCPTRSLRGVHPRVREMPQLATPTKTRVARSFSTKRLRRKNVFCCGQLLGGANFLKLELGWSEGTEGAPLIPWVAPSHLRLDSACKPRSRPMRAKPRTNGFRLRRFASCARFFAPRNSGPVTAPGALGHPSEPPRSVLARHLECGSAPEPRGISLAFLFSSAAEPSV